MDRRPPPPGARLSLRSLTAIRWIALIGQAAALSVAYFGLGLALPFVPAMAVVLAAGAVNVAVTILKSGTTWLKPGEAAALLAFDLLQLAVLLWLTGGLENPFVLLVLAPVTTAAWALPARHTAGLTALAIALVSVLAVWYLPLPWPGAAALPTLYRAGIWIALVIAIGFIAGYIGATSREAARLADALNAAQMALAREQRLSALGGLAAAAAHELGNPLAIMTLVSSELARDMPADNPWHDDVALLVQQSERCRQILAELARRPEQDGGEPYNRLPLSALLEAAAEPHGRSGVEISLPAADVGQSKLPVVARDPQFLHALGAVIENAVSFAASNVTLEANWDAPGLELRIIDDGPGFDMTQLSQVADPYFTTGARGRRSGDEGPHMGLGLFIARTLLAHSGGEVSFGNQKDGPGAVVTLRWPRGIVPPGGDSE